MARRQFGLLPNEGGGLFEKTSNVRREKLDIVSMIDRQHDCLADEPPPCECVCPLGLDVRDFVRKIQAGLYAAAYKTYVEYAAVPGIICHLCHEPCKDACVRCGIDEAVSLRDLETFCWRQGKNASSELFFIPEKGKRLLIVGGGLTGICCALKLATRGYRVDLVEKGKRLGGRLLEFYSDKLSQELINDEFARLDGHSYLHVTLDTEASQGDGNAYDAVLIANEGMPREDEMRVSNVLYAPSHSVLEWDPLVAVKDGVEMSFLLEDYVKTGIWKTPRTLSRRSAYKPAKDTVRKAPKTAPSDGEKWTADNAKSEAERCILCSCENCKNVCEMLTWHRLNAKKLMVNVSDTINKHKFNRRTGIRPVMSCVQCGSCAKTCPVDIDLKHFCIETRRVLHKTEHLPSGYYDYWLNDMRHANGEESSVFVHQSGAQCKYIFFPGCQMGASNPEYVFASYEWLCETLSNEVALMLYCCGAPAYWAGDETLHMETLSVIRAQWIESRNPIFIASCPTCAELLKDHLPEIETVSMWRVMAEHIDRLPERATNGEVVSIFDPCSSKYDRQTQQNIRTLVRRAGYEIEELRYSGATARCCGYGGLVYSSNPQLVERIGEHNRSLGEREFVTYCTNCRDGFTSHGKPSRHILDVLFGDASSKFRKPCDLTQRRKNREKLKKLFHGGEARCEKETSPCDGVKLIIPDLTRDKMNQRLILEDNVKELIHFAETSGRRLYCEDEDVYTAHHEQGKVTLWAEYKPTDGGYLLLNAYAHRMRVEEK
jgi:Fe-S oxidoreductase